MDHIRSLKINDSLNLNDISFIFDNSHLSILSISIRYNFTFNDTNNLFFERMYNCAHVTHLIINIDGIASKLDIINALINDHIVSLVIDTFNLFDKINDSLLIFLLYIIAQHPNIISFRLNCERSFFDDKNIFNYIEPIPHFDENIALINQSSFIEKFNPKHTPNFMMGVIRPPMTRPIRGCKVLVKIFIDHFFDQHTFAELCGSLCCTNLMKFRVHIHDSYNGTDDNYHFCNLFSDEQQTEIDSYLKRPNQLKSARMLLD